jgi:hypothetical protein
MSSKRRNSNGLRGRKLSFEELEFRRMLAPYTVRLAIDIGDETVTDSLSWAIHQANTVAGGPHTINFQLNNGGSQIQVTDQVTIIKAPMTIDGTISGGARMLLVKDGGFVGNGLEIDGSLTGSGTIEIRDLQISNFERNGIQVLAMGTNDVVRIDNTSVHHNIMAGIRVGQNMVASSRVFITGNDIWANGTAGIVAEGAANVTHSNQHSISGNDIGLGTSLGNFGPGVVLGVNARNYTVSGNSFKGNTGDGISVSSNAKGQNLFTGNNFLGNGGIPIDLNDNGARENDPDDVDTGPNNLLNYPVIDAAGIGFNNVTQQWTVPITIDAEETLNTSQYLLEVYKVNPATKEYTLVYNIGNKTVPTSGDLKFTQVIPVNVGGGVTLNPGDRITALMTNSTIGSSEFPEDAILLDAAAPRIVDVKLIGVQPNGTAWTRSPYSFQQIVSAGKQLHSIFTAGVNKIEVQFDEPVAIDGSDFVLTGSAGPIAHSSFVYTPASRIGTWTYAAPLGADKYVLTQVGSVTDAVGKALDGDWDRPANPNLFLTSPTSSGPDWTGKPAQVFTPGNGTPGGDFRLHFAYLPRDYDQDGIVTPGETGGDGDGNDQSGQAGDANVVTNAVNTGMNRLIAGRFRGDYNDNEIVEHDGNFGDYQVWKMSFGSTVDLRADGNDDGVIDGADYSVYRDNLGEVSAWSAQFGAGGAGAMSFPLVLFGVAPQVANVVVSGSNSPHAPYSFDAHDGSGEQLRTVPVGGADTISITFTEDVNIVAADLRLVGLRTANQPQLAEFSYDVGAMTATWRFNGWTFGDQYEISLSDEVTDVEGYQLDGEWTNPASLSTTNALVSTFPSGDGVPGGDFNFVATLLPGDANLDLIVNGADLTILASHYNLSGALFTQGDFNGNGIVDSADTILFSQSWLANLNLQNLTMLSDLNGDWIVDELDGDILFNNYLASTANPTRAQGNLDGDTDIDIHDLDLMFAQYGLELAVVS